MAYELDGLMQQSDSDQRSRLLHKQPNLLAASTLMYSCRCCAGGLIALLSALLLLTAVPRSWVSWVSTAQDMLRGRVGADDIAGVPFASYSLPVADAKALRVVLEAAAGVYVSPTSAAGGRVAKDWHSTVLMTTFNQAYGDMFFNWACNIRHIGPQRLKYVAWAQDRMAAATLIAKADALTADKSAYIYFSAHMAHELGSVLRATSFRSRGFNRLSNFKLVAVRLVLEAGFAVCLSDVDVILLADPWPTFHGAAICDYEYASNNGCTDSDSDWGEGNTGFHLLQPRPPVLGMLRATLESAERDPTTDDQTLMWNEIHSMRRSGKAVHAIGGNGHSLASASRANASRLSYCSWPKKTHTTGQCFNTAAELRGVVTAHANFVTTEQRKVDKLKQAGLWALTADATLCVQPTGFLGWARWLWDLAFYRPDVVAHPRPGLSDHM